MNIKHKLILAPLLALSLAAALPAQSQDATTPPAVATPPTSQGNFVSDIFGYFTVINTNLSDCFQSHKFDLWVGVVSVQASDIPIENEIGLSYDLFRGTATNAMQTIGFFGVEAVSRNGGVAGSLIDQQGGFNAGVVICDIRLSGYADGGYDFYKKRPYGEIGLRAFKALGHNFYAGVQAGVQFPNPAQVLSAITGVAF